MKYAVCFLTVTVVAGIAVGCGSSSSAKANSLIVLDHSIAGVMLKEKQSAVEGSLGRGVVLQTTVDRSAKPTPARFTRVSYEGGSLIVGYVSGARHPARAFFLETRSPRYRTRSGVGVGSSAKAMLSLGGVNCYGGTECQHGYEAVNKPGTTFRLDRPGGRVVFIAMAFGH